MERRNCDKLSIHKKGERNTSVYAYICFRANTSYNSYGAVTRGIATRENVIGKREKEGEEEREREIVSLDDGARRRDGLCYLHPKRYIVADGLFFFFDAFSPDTT